MIIGREEEMYRKKNGDLGGGASGWDKMQAGGNVF